MATNLPTDRAEPARRYDLRNCDRQIAHLVAQLQRDNEVIARLVEDRQQRRRELLAVQERKLRALRGADEGEVIA